MKKKEMILETGLKLWVKNRKPVTFREIAKVIKVTHAGIYYHFSSTAVLYEAIKEKAIKENNEAFISIMICENDDCVSEMSKEEKLRIISNYIG